MNTLLRIEDDVLEGTDFWVVAALAVRRAGQSSPVLLTQSDISGLISIDIFQPPAGASVYSATFSKTINQDGVSEAIHAAAIDSLWGLDDIGHNFKHQIRQADVGSTTLKGGRRYTIVYSIPTARDGTVKLIAVANIVPLH